MRGDAERVGGEEVECPGFQRRTAAGPEQRQRAEAEHQRGADGRRAAAHPARQGLRQPQQAEQEGEELQVGDDVPGAGGQRLGAGDVVDQQQVEEHLAKRRGRRGVGVGEDGAGERGADDGQGQGDEEWRDEAAVATAGECCHAAPVPRRPRRVELRRQTARGKKAADDEEGLHRHARVDVEPVDEGRRIGAQGFDERAVGDEVVPDDQLRGQGLDEVDRPQRRGRGGGRRSIVRRGGHAEAGREA